MKVCIVQAIIGGGGGNDIVLKYTLEALDSENHDVTLFTTSKPLIDLKYKTITILPFRLPIFGVYQQLLGYKTPKSFNQFDVILVLTGNMVLNRTKRPLFYYNQNNFGDVTDNPNSKYRKGLWAIYYLPFRIILKLLKEKMQKSNVNFLANSYYIAQKMKQRYYKQAQVVYPPVDLKELKNNTKKNQVITIARFSQEKNLEQAIEIMKEMELPYYVYGKATKTNQIYYQQLQRKAGTNTQLCYDRPREELLNCLSESRVYLHTSVETFGISVVEAIASGCIPIVPNNSAHNETVPFDDLRYNNLGEAYNKVKLAMNGEFDSYLEPLKNNIQRFDKNVFQGKILSLLNERETFD